VVVGDAGEQRVALAIAEPVDTSAVATRSRLFARSEDEQDAHIRDHSTISTASEEPH
jgi:hypothetical protein